VGRIRILSDEVANKIAAGEVVERPASVVKELLENSLDAGATRVRVEVEAGGRRLIRVTDDGTGMLRDDALLAFERHATSKLSDVKDLLAIDTLGFRGEALPSVASVSRLVLETRSADEETGTRVEIAGGRIRGCDEAALAPGTVVTVRDLFFNVPARRKFLRSQQTELAHIAGLVTHYSLAHPDKTFQLMHEASELLHATPVAGLRERVYQVFGSQVVAELVELGERTREMSLPPPPWDPDQAPETRRFALHGFVSQPQVQKLNRNSIFLFVNRRLIRDRTLLHALTSAYHNLMPAACYPFALLFLECDREEVDVNVHPSKTEVRFRHGSFIHDFVRDAIRETLVASRPVSSLPAEAFGQPAARLPYSEFSQQMESARLGETPSLTPPPASWEGLPEFTLRPQAPSPAAGRLDFGPTSEISNALGEPAAPASAIFSRNVPDTHGPLAPEALAGAPASLDSLGDLRPLGQIHDSFIVAAGNDGLWIIDQHVAHERVLFESVLRQMAAGRVESQRLLLPVVLDLTAGQQADYGRISGELTAIGFEIELIGPRSIAVQAAPAAVGAAEIEKLIFEILEISSREMRRLSMDDLRRQVAASVACRAAIKIHTPLDDNKMRWLLQALAVTECPMSCPHGRPIALRYATREILRGFHRI